LEQIFFFLSEFVNFGSQRVYLLFFSCYIFSCAPLSFRQVFVGFVEMAQALPKATLDASQ